jgi:hypothetical protein
MQAAQQNHCLSASVLNAEPKKCQLPHLQAWHVRHMMQAQHKKLGIISAQWNAALSM